MLFKDIACTVSDISVLFGTGLVIVLWHLWKRWSSQSNWATLLWYR